MASFPGLGPFARIQLAPFLDLVMVWNRGVSYGLFQAGGLTGTILLTVFSLVAVAALSWWLRMPTGGFRLGPGLGYRGGPRKCD